MNRGILVLVFALSAALASAASVSGQDAPKIPAIDAAMQSFVEAKQISGAVTLVAHRGKIVHLGAVGSRNLEASQEMKTFTMFSIASMTKPIVATAVMILVEEGKLQVDDKVSQYIPAFAMAKLESGAQPSREITIRDLLTHTSGLTGSQAVSGSLAETAEALARRPLAFEPGTRWQYSPGLNVAGRIVEIVSEMPLAEFLQERIFQPLQMTNTTFYPDAKQQQRLAVLYAPSEDKSELIAVKNSITRFSADSPPSPSGGLVATARDLFRFYQMALNGGTFHQTRLLSNDSVQLMLTSQTGDLETGFTPGNCWGLGWCIVREPQGVTAMLSPGTFGHGGAFGTQGWVDPKTETIYVLMIQRTKLGNSDGSDIRQRFQQAAVDALGL
jgi:CubicO group peptidase (beta-lactamase class C family)